MMLVVDLMSAVALVSALIEVSTSAEGLPLSVLTRGSGF